MFSYGAGMIKIIPDNHAILVLEKINSIHQ